MKSPTLIALFLFPFCLIAQTYHNWKLTNPDVDFDVIQILNDQYYAGRSNHSDGPVLLSMNNTTAEVEWAKTYQESGFEQMSSYGYLKMAPNNKIILGFSPEDFLSPESTATIVSSLNLQGVPEWSKKMTFSHRYDLIDFSFDSQGELLLLGFGQEEPAEDGKIWVTSMDTLGNINWIKSYSAGTGTYGQSAYKIDGLPSGDIYVSLQYPLPSGKAVNSIIKLDNNGDVLWSRNFKGANNESIHYRCVGADSNGDIIFVGNGDSFSSLYGHYGLVMKMNNAGEVLYSRVVWVDNMLLLYAQLHFYAAIDKNKAVLGGTVSHNVWGNVVAFAIKLDENGHKLNEQIYPHPQNSSVSFPYPYQNSLEGMAKTRTTGYTLTGVTYGHTIPEDKDEAFIIETDDNLVAPCNSEPPANPFIVEDYPLTTEDVTLTVKEEIHNWVDAVILAKPYVLNDTIICQTTVGTEEMEQAVEHKSVHISPNPVSGTLMLMLDSNWSGKPLSITITDALCREVINRNQDGGVNAVVQLDVTNLIPGPYYLTASNAEMSETIRFVVQH